MPSNKRLQLTAARFGCRSVLRGRRPPGCALDSRASAGRHLASNTGRPQLSRDPLGGGIQLGTYTELEVAGYPLWSTKSAVDPEAMTVFRETDKRIEKRKLSARNPLVWGPFEGSEDEVETAVFYACRVGHVRARLDVMGFTLDRVRCEFEMLRNDEMEKFESWAEQKGDEWFADDRDFMASLTFDKYAAAFRHVIEGGLRFALLR